MSFPLYDRLISHVQKTDVALKPFTTKDMIQICEQIHSLPKQASDLVYVLIKIHSLRHNDSKYFEYPYQSVLQVSDEPTELVTITFTFYHLPIVLQYILHQFLIFNKEAIKEEQEQRRLSPRSRKSRSKSPPQSTAVKSFMKKNVSPTFELKQIDIGAIDKLYNMEEIFNRGDVLLSEPSQDQQSKSTKIELLGFSSPDDQASTILYQEPDETAIKQCCQYCVLALPSHWKPIPYQNRFFCSFNCLLAFFPTCDIFAVYEQLTGQRLYQTVIPSPSFTLLSEYGGDMEPRDYQKRVQDNQLIWSLSQHRV